MASNITTSPEKKGIISEDLRKRAYIPEPLPNDFLRVVLNQQQMNENNDSFLAHRLQYNLNGHPGAYMGYAPQMRVYEQPVGRGRLQIDVIEAKLQKNYGFTKMDPYVRLRLGPKVFETPTAHSGGKNPKWLKTVMCYLPMNVDTLSIEIFDEKAFTDDELIAFVKFPLPNSLFEGTFIDEWIPLSGKLGEQKEGYINIQLLFTPNENLRNIGMPVQVARPQVGVLSSSSSSSSGSSSLTVSPQGSTIIQPRVVNLPSEPGAINLANNTSQQTYSEADLESIKEMFPSFDAEVIKSILESNHGNKESSIEALLQMSEC